LTACVYDLPRDAQDRVHRETLACIGAGLAAARTPGFLINQTIRPVSEFSRNLMVELGIPAVTGGLDLAVKALAATQRWSQRRSASRRCEARTPDQRAAMPARPVSEYEALAYLRTRGVPIPPAVLVRTPEEAIAAWRTLGVPVVLKIAASAIQHKSDIGGVRLNLDSETAIRNAFAAILAAARLAHPGAVLDGCLLMPMRTDTIELFVGIAQSSWGPVIAAGLGGVWIEALADTSVRLLPITIADARAMLDELRGRRILDGYRGAPAANLDAVAAVMQTIGDAALSLGPDLVALEVNPLAVHGAAVEALDALVVWEDDGNLAGHSNMHTMTGT
jgi:hypothetical protein